MARCCNVAMSYVQLATDSIATRGSTDTSSEPVLRYTHTFIIIRNQLDLDRPVSASSKSQKVFQVVSIHSVDSSPLFLASCPYSFLLHVVANVIFVFLVSRHLVLLSTFTKFHCFSYGKYNSLILESTFLPTRNMQNLNICH